MQTHTLYYIAFHSIPFRTVPYHAVPCCNIHPSVRPSIDPYIHTPQISKSACRTTLLPWSSTTTEWMLFSSKPPEVNPWNHNRNIPEFRMDQPSSLHGTWDATWFAASNPRKLRWLWIGLWAWNTLVRMQGYFGRIIQRLPRFCACVDFHLTKMAGLKADKAGNQSVTTDVSGHARQLPHRYINLHLARRGRPNCTSSRCRSGFVLPSMWEQESLRVLSISTYPSYHWNQKQSQATVIFLMVSLRGCPEKPGDSDSETNGDSETAIQKLRFRNYLHRFRNYGDSETIAIQKLRFRNYRDSETIPIQKLSRFRN